VKYPEKQQKEVHNPKMATPEADMEHDSEEAYLDPEFIRTALLEKVYGGNKEQLENDIQAKKDEQGAINDVSALRKLVSEKGRREVGSTSVAGYYLQRYELKPREGSTESAMSVYLATKQGVRTIHGRNKADMPNIREYKGKLVFGDRQTWSDLSEVENVLTGTRMLYVNKGKTRLAQATQEEIGPDLWNMSADITKITDGQHTWRAYIGAIFPVGIFENQQAVGNKPILENNGLANLRVGLTDSVDPKTLRPGQTKTFVQITQVDQLHTFLGEYYDEAMLMGEPKEVARELRDALNGYSVIVFGSGKTPQSPNQQKNRRVKEPKIGIWGGRGTIAPWKVPSRSA
jgi:hypothetical protein